MDKFFFFLFNFIFFIYTKDMIFIFYYKTIKKFKKLKKINICINIEFFSCKIIYEKK